MTVFRQAYAMGLEAAIKEAGRGLLVRSFARLVQSREPYGPTMRRARLSP
jgi:hypothetical protein